MSTNFYLRRTKPILTFPEFHIAKRSHGWKPLYEANSMADDVWSFETERPVVKSVDDIKSYVDSGEWEIVDAYDNVMEYDEFKSYMETDFDTEVERKHHIGYGCMVSVDRDGSEWMEAGFR